MRRVALIAITGGALAGCGGGGAPAAPDAGRDAAPPPTVDAPAPVADANAEPDAAPPDDVLLARTPPMGWNSWNHFHCDVSERLVRETADALVASGLADAGYRNVVIDDCWQVARDAGGTIVADRDRFPSGIAALADYVHGKGLKLGIYTDAGPQTCQNRPGSLGHERDDAATYAAWGVDYVKVDWCHNEGLDPRTQYAVVRDALAAAGRPIVFSICNWGVDSPWIWGPETGQLWRTTGDIEDSWQSMTGIAALTALHPAAARPGAWNDPDMLEVGNGGMTDDEYRVHFSLWAILAAPLMAGNDVRAMSPATLEILGNREVIAVDQDRLGLQGVLVRDSGGLQVWVKPLADPGARAVALVNRTGAAASISASWSDLGLAPGAATVRDLWAHTDRGSAVGSTAAMVPSHGVAMLRIVGAEPTPPAGTSYLSDWTWTHAVNGWGPAERDRSNAEMGAGDGAPLTIGGAVYAKGVGAHAASVLRVHLGGRCSRLTADIGIDDEAGDHGSVVFEVRADGETLFTSGVLTGAAPAQPIDVDVRGKGGLELAVRPAGDNHDYDHADWGNARLVCQ